MNDDFEFEMKVDQKSFNALISFFNKDYKKEVQQKAVELYNALAKKNIEKVVLNFDNGVTMAVILSHNNKKETES